MFIHHTIDMTANKKMALTWRSKRRKR